MAHGLFDKPLRLALALAAALMLAGCASDGSGGPDGPGADAGYRDLSIASRVVADGTFVEVMVRHRSHFHRVEEVALIGPDGAWHRARDLSRRKTTSNLGRPHGHFGVAGGSHGPIVTGVGISIPLGAIGALFESPAHRTRALVQVPDPAGYRADPAGWQIAVVMGRGLGGTTTIKQPAPAPR